MSLRTRLIIAFLILSVVPLSAVTLIWYFTSVRAFERAAEREATETAADIGRRMEMLTANVGRRMDRLFDEAVGYDYRYDSKGMKVQERILIRIQIPISCRRRRRRLPVWRLRPQHRSLHRQRNAADTHNPRMRERRHFHQSRRRRSSSTCQSSWNRSGEWHAHARQRPASSWGPASKRHSKRASRPWKPASQLCPRRLRVK